jgi:hypothetical protein
MKVALSTFGALLKPVGPAACRLGNRHRVRFMSIAVEATEFSFLIAICLGSKAFRATRSWAC